MICLFNNRELGNQLSLEFGAGFSHINLWLFVRFATDFPDIQMVYALRKLFSWTHFEFLSASKAKEPANWNSAIPY
jgi:hypothetical protein